MTIWIIAGEIIAPGVWATVTMVTRMIVRRFLRKEQSMPPNPKTTKTARPVSFRPSTVTERQIAELVALWGEDRSQVINRCIERVWAIEKRLAELDKSN